MSRSAKHYELFYSWGGHGGPYKSLKDAICSAKLLIHNMNKHSIIVVREREADKPLSEGKIRARIHPHKTELIK